MLKSWIHRARLVATVTVGLLCSSAAFAQDFSCNQNVEFIDSLGTRVIDILTKPDGDQQTREDRLSQLLEANFDLPLIARAALGNPYRTLTEEQRADYEAVFSTYVLKTYTARLSKYRGYRFEVGDDVDAGRKDVIVDSLMASEGIDPFEVSWRVRCRDDVPKIIDVQIEGISMVLTQRNEFGSAISNNGFDGFMALLREKISATDSPQTRRT